MMLAGLLVGCGQEQGGTGDGAGGAPAEGATTVPAASQLTVTARADGAAAARTWKLTCDPSGGDHPDPARACAALDKAKDPYAPVPEDAICTKIYGGPQTATITGTWNGAPVNATYSRADGCELARWQALAPVFPTGAAAAGR
jgi:hypothetical protein